MNTYPLMNFHIQSTQPYPSSKASSQTTEQPDSLDCPWSLKDDKRLLTLAIQTNKDWKMISRIFNKPSMTPTRTKQRYTELYSLYNTNKKRFSYLEDLIIVKAIQHLNGKWVQISQDFLPFRTPIEIKNRYYCSIKKRGVEDQLLDQLKIFEQDTKMKVEDALYLDQKGFLKKQMIQPAERKINTQDNQYESDNIRMIQSLSSDVKNIIHFVNDISWNISQILNLME